MGAVASFALLAILIAPVQVPGDMGQTTDSMCAGDCNGDGQVTIGEILKCINILLDPFRRDLFVVDGQCSAIDVNRNGLVEIGEIVAAVDNLLDGCPDSD